MPSKTENVEISALIFTKDNIDRCLKLCKKLRKFVDEIVIVDSSLKRNYELLKRKLSKTVDVHVSIVNLPPIGMADLYHQIGLNLTKNDWIINIDDDEEPNLELLKNLKKIVSIYGDLKCFKITRIDLRNKHREKIPRLFNKKFILATGVIHQSRIPKTNCLNLDDSFFLIHYNKEQQNICKCIGKLRNYALIESYQWGYKILYWINSQKDSGINRFLKKMFKLQISFGWIGWFLVSVEYNIALLIHKIFKQPKDFSTILYTLCYHIFVQCYLLFEFKQKINISKKMFEAGSPIKFLGLEDIESLDNIGTSLGNDGLVNFIKLVKYKYRGGSKW